MNNFDYVQWGGPCTMRLLTNFEHVWDTVRTKLNMFDHVRRVPMVTWGTTPCPVNRQTAKHNSLKTLPSRNFVGGKNRISNQSWEQCQYTVNRHNLNDENKILFPVVHSCNIYREFHR